MALGGSIECVINGEEIEIPKDILTNKKIFQSIFSEETWRGLDTKEKTHLMEYLPAFPSESTRQQYETLREIFGGSTNFKFGSPVNLLYEKIVGGHLFPDVVKQRAKCRKAKHKSYKLMRKEYYRALIQQILISRQRILDKANRHGGGYVGHFRPHQVCQTVSLDERVKRKYERILRDIKQESQDNSPSSDEEDSISPGKDLPMPFPPSYYTLMGPPRSGLGGKSRMPPFHSPPPFMRMIPPSAYPCMPPSGHFWESSPQGQGIVDDEYRTMLERHRKRRICNENHPELDTSDTTLADIITRANPAKKAKVGKKIKEAAKSNAKPVKVKKKVKVKPKEQPPAKVKEEPKEITKVKEEPEEIVPPATVVCSEPASVERKPDLHVSEEIQYQFGCFFSLLRGLLKDSPQATCTMDQLRQKVIAWQMNDKINPEEWTKLTSDWSELVSTALKYLAGEGKATLIQDFVPMATMTENPRECKWTGQGYDDDDILIPLCAHWLDTVNKPEDNDSFFQGNEENMESAREEGGSSAAQARDHQDFIDQERKRYENPHKPYTYRSNGSTSVVGAVKGVFHKESGFSKAREHALLVSNRPAYVTILSLVKDAVARLPNGEGTRAEVCGLLKDSQFINPDASDAQIHTVVSGALDRLHAERDPCVKYDITRKVWIYLHRNRTEGEFERIHQASAAASLAKKQYTQRQKSVKQKKALQDLVDQQEKSSRDSHSDQKSTEGHPVKKAAKRPKQTSQGDSSHKGEKTKAAKESGEKTTAGTPVKASKSASSSGSARKDVKSPPQKTEASLHRSVERSAERPSLAQSLAETINIKTALGSSPPIAHQKGQESPIAAKVKLPFSVTKPVVPSAITETVPVELPLSKDKIKEEETIYTTVTLDAGISKILTEGKRDADPQTATVPNTLSATPLAIRPTVTPVNPVLNIVPPHCTAAKFVRLPFSHAATITPGLSGQSTSKGQTVTKYSAVHLPNQSSSVLITVPPHADRVAPLRISLPRASIGPNINVTRAIQSPTPVEFSRTARPGVILSRMAAPLGTHQRIFVRQIPHESLKPQPKSQAPVVTTASR